MAISMDNVVEGILLFCKLNSFAAVMIQRMLTRYYIA
jgi:hypothetical protein